MILLLVSAINSGLVLVYGLFLSVLIAGGWESRRQRTLVVSLCPGLLLIQALSYLALGEQAVRQLYPLIVHLPLVLILIFPLKKPMGVSVVSVLTAYLCCQLPRWGQIAVSALTHSELAGELAYSLCIGPIFFLLLRFFVKPAHSTMTYSRQALLLFGSLPAVYYVFDYATAIYSDWLYAGIPVVNELIPTFSILFYVIFLSAYHQETQQRTRAELESAAQSALFRQAQRQMEALQAAQAQTAVYRHDMRHHLNVIHGFLSAGNPEQALAYIRKAQDSIDALCIKRYCENDTMNLVCSSFQEKAERMGIALTIRAQLPRELPLSDPELCAIVSNALENALHAAAHPELPQKWAELYCGIRHGKLLLEVKNPYTGAIPMEDGLPVTTEPGHGFGCRSIRSIVLQHQGLYTFSPENGIFTLQIVLPLSPSEGKSSRITP